MVHGVRGGMAGIHLQPPEPFDFKVAQYPGFLRLTNLEIHADRLFAFLIC